MGEKLSGSYVVLLGGLVLGAAACTSREADKPVFSERQLQAVVSAQPTLALGESCDTGRSSACVSALCVKTGLERGHGYFCSTECASETNCPVDWLCKQVMTGPHGQLCIPPNNWQSLAVGVRP